MAQAHESLAAYPRLYRGLSTASENRLQRTKIVTGGPFGKGAEELLSTLAEYRQSLGARGSSAASQILGRVEADFVVAFDAWLSGAHTVVIDMMRGVMEAEYLIDDFAASPTGIEDWLEFSERKRRTVFHPAELRKRRAQRKGLEPHELLDGREYSLHSANLHVTPTPCWFAPRGFFSSDDSWSLEFCLAEIFEHAMRFLQVVEDLTACLAGETKTRTDWMKKKPALFAAWEETRFRMEVFKQLSDGSREFEFLDEGPLDMLAMLRWGHAKRVADEIRARRDEVKPPVTEEEDTEASDV